MTHVTRVQGTVHRARAWSISSSSATASRKVSGHSARLRIQQLQLQLSRLRKCCVCRRLRSALRCRRCIRRHRRGFERLQQLNGVLL